MYVSAVVALTSTEEREYFINLMTVKNEKQF